VPDGVARASPSPRWPLGPPHPGWPPAISIATWFDYRVPFEEQVPLIAEAGFTHLSLGAREDHTRYRSAAGRAGITALLRANGLALDTIHGPRLDQPDSVVALGEVAEAAAELGAGVVVVVHASPFDFPPHELADRERAAVLTCQALQSRAAAVGVRFALENVLPGPATELVCRVLDQVDPTVFGACYDSSHDQIGGPRPFILLDVRGWVVQDGIDATGPGTER
jgi:sugar phosphate isomerase/epimerase